jgi:hypothetical protein
MNVLIRNCMAGWAAAWALCATAVPVSGQGTWESTLKARDINGQPVSLDSDAAAFYYDTALNITWTRNLAMNGAANWSISSAWVHDLTIGGFSDWRLPHTFDSGAPGCDFSFDGATDCGYNVMLSSGGVTNELAHLFYSTLGNLAAYAPVTGLFRGGQPGLDWGLVNTAHFQGDFADGYWTDLLVQAAPNPDAYFFRFSDGATIPGGNGIQDMLAVRDGDVWAGTGGGGGGGSGTPVPAPASLGLALCALAVLAARQRALSVKQT